MAFEDWKKDQKGQAKHPGEEDIACFLEGKLDVHDSAILKEHLITCDACAELLAADLRAFPAEEMPVPEDLLERARGMLVKHKGISALDIIVKARDPGWEIISTTGDVLFGQELIPAAVLRSRNIQEFKDEVVVLKDFVQSIVEVRLQHAAGAGFNVSVAVKDRKSQKVHTDSRITLSKEGVELESKISDTGRVVFEHVEPAVYSIDVEGPREKIAVVCLEVRK
jgi:hypothetical protein